MIQLGISAFYHDSAACIVKDGKVIAAVEEERFTEIKHDYSFPLNSINWCLEETGISIEEINEVCWYEVPEKKKDRVLKSFSKRPFKTFFTRRKFLKEFKKNNPETILKENYGYQGRITYIDHHLSHAAFSFYSSPYKDAAILTVDGVGEFETVTISKGDEKGINKKLSIDFPNSLGMLYSTITAYLGFKPNEGEYKVMGLAPYGKPDKYYERLEQIFINKTTNKFEIDQKYFTWEYSDKIMFTKHLAKLLVLPPRLPEEEVTQEHKNLASALQNLYEREFLKLVNRAKHICNSENLCLGGGCAYNGVANNKAYKHFNSIHIPFAPSDAGSAIGACLVSYLGPKHQKISPYLGNSYSDEYIRGVLEDNTGKVSFVKYDDEGIVKRTAKLINNQHIIAWFQGKMEFGARALGNRSILASPRDARMRDRLNYIIKKREGFRPFAPSVLLQDIKKYFMVTEAVPYMNQVVRVKNSAKHLFPAATHIDKTARIQSVDEHRNNRYYLLLQELKRITGHGVVLNTSFNLKDQTITRTPEQAVSRFINSDIRYLVINNFLVLKK
tara:strand:- start:975 stop:2645 length:1671 start_codon:yes stop_codon:yes gene_type:complete